MTASVIVPQSGSARITRLVKEVVPGTTPTGAQWLRLRNTGGQGASSEVETIESNELPGQVLGLRDIIRVGETGTFEYPFELLYDDTTDLLFESLLNNSFATDTLVPGTEEVVFTIEDELPRVKESEYVRNTKVGTFSVSLQSAQIVTGSWGGQGSTTGVAALRTVFPAAGAVTFTAPNVIDYSASSLPGTPPVAGDYVQITGADIPSNNGYYLITDVTGDLVTVSGSIAASAANASVQSDFTGETQYSLSAPAGETVSTVSAMKVGNNVEAKIDDEDVLLYGLRFPQVDINVTTELTDLREITEDAPYSTLPSDRTVELTINFHVINLFPIRKLRNDAEFKLEFSVSDSVGNKYTFTFPRCKSAPSSKGPATKGETMTGDWAIQSLLDPSNVNIQIDR